MAIYPKDLSEESLELNSSLKLFQIYKNLKHVSIKCDTYFQVYEELFNKYIGKKNILDDEQPTINFAYASVVTTKDMKKGEIITEDNIWVKRPGTGEIRAKDYYKLLNKKENFTETEKIFENFEKSRL